MSAHLKTTPCCTEVELGSAMPMFYVVGKNKLVIMLCMTFGYYFIYWNYRNWKAYRLAVGAKIWPVGRTVLGIFFLYSLFMKIDRQLRISKRHYNWHPQNLMVGAILAAGISTYICVVGVNSKAIFPMLSALVASSISFLFSEYVNSYLLSKIKELTNSRFLFLRVLLSTCFAVVIDSFLFCFIAFYGSLTNDEILKIVYVQIAIKMCFAVFNVFPAYAARSLFKRYVVEAQPA